jgi:hypothetical protein
MRLPRLETVISVLSIGERKLLVHKQLVKVDPVLLRTKWTPFPLIKC